MSVSNGPEAQSVPKEEEQEEQGEGSEDEWEQVGPRNKSSVTRQADFVQTPITDIFGGHIRYSTYSYKFFTCSAWIFFKKCFKWTGCSEIPSPELHVEKEFEIFML